MKKFWKYLLVLLLVLIVIAIVFLFRPITSKAIKTKNDYQKKFGNNKVDIQKTFVNGKTLHKVFIRGFKSYDDATNFKNMNSLDNAVISNN